MNSSHHVAAELPGASPARILREACCQCIDQCLDVIKALPDPVYRQASPAHSSIGIHFRHVIERLQCVILGVETGIVDYDCRERDPRLEQSPSDALAALRAIRSRLAALDTSPPLQVRESVLAEGAAPTLPSSLDRELMSLVSHTIHHLALIALLARSQGVELDASIGKAPSTLLYERSSGRDNT